MIYPTLAPLASALVTFIKNDDDSMPFRGFDAAGQPLLDEMRRLGLVTSDGAFIEPQGAWEFNLAVVFDGPQAHNVSTTGHVETFIL